MRMTGTTILEQIMKIRRHVVLMVCCLFSFLSYGSVQDTSHISADSVSTIISDTSKVKEISGLPLNYVLLDTSKIVGLSPRADSLLNTVTSDYSNLSEWFDRMDKHKKHRDILPTKVKNYRPSWVVVVLISILIALGLVRLFFHHTFLNVIYGYFNERILTQISKEDNVLTSWPYIFLYIIFSFSLGLFLVIYFSAKDDHLFLSMENFAKVSITISVLFVAKLLLLRIISVIFQIKRLAKSYITVLYLVYFNSMLILLPILILSVFLPFVYIDYLMIVFAVVVILLFGYRMIRTAFGLLGNLKFSIFYLILYLCALEIAPILILVKSLNN